MAISDKLKGLTDDGFDLEDLAHGDIGHSVRAQPDPTPEVEEPAPEPTKQISARLPLSRYRRLKLALMESDETQEELVNRLVEGELRRLGA